MHRLLRTASDRALLQLPLEGAESLTLNTVPYRPGMVGTYAGGADLLRVGSRPTSFATLVLPSDAVEKLLEPTAESRLLQPGGFALIQAPPAFVDQAKRIVIAARATASTMPDVFEAEQPRFALRDALLKAAHDLVSPKPDVKFTCRAAPNRGGALCFGRTITPHPHGPTDLLGGTL